MVAIDMDFTPSFLLNKLKHETMRLTTNYFIFDSVCCECNSADQRINNNLKTIQAEVKFLVITLNFVCRILDAEHTNRI